VRAGRTVDRHKQAEIEIRTPEFMAAEATKPFGWPSDHWIRWATVNEAIRRLEIPSSAAALDVGAGSGWTSLFLAEQGFSVVAVDLVPANIELIRRRAARWGAAVDARVADMEELSLAERFDLVLVHDALHHSGRQDRIVAAVARHLVPGGWALFGEPSWLHAFSPHARETTRRIGWRERGVRVRALRRDCRAAGLEDFRRFFQPTQPYESRAREFAWQLVRLVAANVAFAPQAEVWLAARRPPTRL
jgi:SAM-dependent methyltransferase